MLAVVLRRLGLMVLVFAGLVVIAFLMTQVLPGDPARAAAGRNASPEQIAAVASQLGLDQPVWRQFLRYAGRLLHGDLGTSVVTHRPVLADLGEVLPVSLELVLAAMLLNLVIGVPLGVLAAYRRGRWADGLTRVVVLLGAAVPAFWLGLILQLVLSDRLHWLPLSGRLTYGYRVDDLTGMVTFDALVTGRWATFGNALAHLVLPAVTLAAPFIAVVARTVRSSMISVLDADFVQLARATGAGEWRVVVRHALRNALGPIITIVGMQLGWMLGATVLVESTFNRGGIGAYTVNAVLQNDLYAVIGSVLAIGVVFIVANVVVDLLQPALDPRLRGGGRAVSGLSVGGRPDLAVGPAGVTDPSAPDVEAGADNAAAAPVPVAGVQR
ncbi:ABC transporter permease [Nakamurella endophytica]|uniref:Peptide ABC transporter permease n=1 Tax=Nakamurella endophytica TaxID=1748367 RepID=A0A917WM29_9ACTN|nr:ABC transporter permease [Nakamurella endophytica]GGM15499.1 peptide ABC transporter permease [Nakamurella endophytica]